MFPVLCAYRGKAFWPPDGPARGGQKSRDFWPPGGSGWGLGGLHAQQRGQIRSRARGLEHGGMPGHARPAPEAGC